MPNVAIKIIQTISCDEEDAVEAIRDELAEKVEARCGKIGLSYSGTRVIDRSETEFDVETMIETGGEPALAKALVNEILGAIHTERKDFNYIGTDLEIV